MVVVAVVEMAAATVVVVPLVTVVCCCCPLHAACWTRCHLSLGHCCRRPPAQRGRHLHTTAAVRGGRRRTCG